MCSECLNMPIKNSEWVRYYIWARTYKPLCCSDTWSTAKGRANTFLSQHFCHSSRSLSSNLWGRALTLVNDALSQRLCSSKSIYECKLIAFRINFNKERIFTMFPSWTHLNATESNQLIQWFSSTNSASVLCFTYTLYIYKV